MVDHLSLEITFDAFEEMKLRGLIGEKPSEFRHSIEETVFISRAYAMCHARTDFSWNQDNTHPPGFHRINRGLSNFRPFATTFNCTKEDNMWTKNECSSLLH